jgi:hypothetical protein
MALLHGRSHGAHLFQGSIFLKIMPEPTSQDAWSSGLSTEPRQKKTKKEEMVPSFIKQKGVFFFRLS